MAQMTLTQRRKLYRMSWHILSQASSPDVRETYCNQCDTWSPDDDWEDIVEFSDDDKLTADAYKCPRCGHLHPPYDPPTRGESR
jgi:hypothetical protein